MTSQELRMHKVMIRSRRCHKPLIVFLFLISAVVGLLSVSCYGGTAQAAVTSAPGVLRVSPALSDFSLSPGETSTTVVTTVTNPTSSRLTIAISVRDFGAQADKPGAISLYTNGYNPKTNPHSLQATMSVNPSSVVLGAHESEKVAVILSNLDQLAPGGHYGAVLFSPQSVVAGGGSSKVSLQSAVASLIFLKTASGGTQQLRLLPLNLDTLRFGLPSSLYVDFTNTGNTQTAPRGQLTLFGPTGTIVSTTVLNTGSGLILPGSSRLFTVDMFRPSPLHALPGKYRLELRYRTDGQARLTVVSRTFYYVNLAVILPALVLVFVLVWLLKTYHGLIWRTGRQFIRWLHNRLRKPKELPPPPKPKKRPPPLIQG